MVAWMDYVEAKRSLFAHLPPSSYAVLNMDDPVGGKHADQS